MARSGWKESGMRIFLPPVNAPEPKIPRQAIAARVRPVGRYPLLIAVFIALIAGILAAQPPTIFRTDVSLVRVVTTVKTQAGQVIGDLGKDNFEIYDRGVLQKIQVF